MIAASMRPMDDDNLAAALKPLRDAVARTLGVDDGDPRVEWRCAQVRGGWGAVAVVIEKHRQTDDAKPIKVGDGNEKRKSESH